MYIPANVINPISGCTIAEERAIQSVIGGRLPFDALRSLIRRGVIKLSSLKRKDAGYPADAHEETIKALHPDNFCGIIRSVNLQNAEEANAFGISPLFNSSKLFFK